jgi:lipoprotein-anchoring transpeptidase ErfK/SrfK
MGTARVASIAPGPHYTFDPDRFPRSPEARLIQGTLTIPPGPNNPVGTMWIGLDLPGYGVHGTPEPERVGEAASLGCFRLSNWNAELLGRLAWVGMPVLIEP